jgi:hypothetical protein
VFFVCSLFALCLLFALCALRTAAMGHAGAKIDGLARRRGAAQIVCGFDAPIP